jgi:MEMO1 family protein
MDHPRLRPLLQAAPADGRGQFYALFDRTGLSDAQIRLSRRDMELIQRSDGSESLDAIRQDFAATHSEQAARHLVEQLDRAFFLDTPRFRERIAGPVRPASCAGRAYEDDPDELRRRLHGLFARGAGQPGEHKPDPALRAILAPHIDYTRGGLSYTYAFRELFERSPAKLFVVVATSHYSGNRFTLTRKHFQTPLGTVPTDQAFIDRVVAHYGDGLFDDEFGAHMPEHSVELEVVFLQYLYEKRRDIRIVPLLVGSFQDCVRSRVSPGTRPDIRRMADALRAAEREAGEPVCYVVSGDLAHIGPYFGDEGNLRDEPLAHSRRQDQVILDAATSAEPDAYFRVIADEGDERRICGLPPTWLTLAVAGASSGRMLHYDQYVDPRRSQSVSFASMAFDR